MNIDKKGVALILALGVLSILAIIATSFALNMRLEYKASVNFANTLRSKYAAEAGVADAIDKIRQSTKISFTDSSTWVAPSGTVSTNPDVTYTVQVKDCASQININMADKTSLKKLIDNLVDVAISTGATYNNVGDIIANYAPTGGYKSKEEIKAVWYDYNGDGTVDQPEEHISDNMYRKIKDYITISGRPDSRWSNRSPINVNTADLRVLKSVLRGLVPGETSDPFTKADALADQIVATRATTPFNTWADLWNCINLVAGLSSSDKQSLWLSLNSYLNVPFGVSAGSPIWVMAGTDSWKVTAYPPKTTEFCLTSAGAYDITSTGTVKNIAGGAGITLATYKINTIAKVSDLVYHTTKSDFEGVNNGDPTPVAFKVTTANRCPIDSLLDPKWGTLNAKWCYDAIKIGYWDDFDEPGTKYYDSVDGWTSTRESIWNSGGAGTLGTGNPDPIDGDFELVGFVNGTSPSLSGWLVGTSGTATATSGTASSCFNWKEFTLRTELQDYGDPANNRYGPLDVYDQLGGPAPYYSANTHNLNDPPAAPVNRLCRGLQMGA
ncbi:MAG: type II secretion system protein GspK, partial [Candidatus Omnitrophota bacterium]|nr:type II secretion system protein GspK [Candidatus Omnitrophota bacterium]